SRLCQPRQQSAMIISRKRLKAALRPKTGHMAVASSVLRRSRWAIRPAIQLNVHLTRLVLRLMTARGESRPRCGKGATKVLFWQAPFLVAAPPSHIVASLLAAVRHRPVQKHPDEPM